MSSETRKIAIFGDTSQDLSQELAKMYNIVSLSYQVQMDDEHYKDQIDIDTKTFYEKLPKHKVLMTGTPSLFEVEEKFEKMKREGYTDLILISSSSKLTGMYSLYSSYGDSFKGMNLHIIDTGFIGAAAGILVIYASYLREQGMDVKDIVKEVEKKKKKVHIYALFRTLSYLVKGGRFNKYKGMIGNLLDIKPLLSVEDGLISVKKKYRGESKSLLAMISVMKEEIKKYKKYWLVIYSGENEEEVAILREKMKAEIEGASLYIETEITPVLGVHGGPRVVGLVCLGLD